MPGIAEKLHPGLQRRIKESGWSALLPIQEEAIPFILDGHDCVIQAPTAGGKTEAVLFPTLTRAALTNSTGVRVLYVAPLRALLNNLQDRCERYAGDCCLNAFKWHGDVSQKDKIDAMQLPPQLLLTTPESIEAILLRKAGWQQLFAGLTSIIVDEVHNFAASDRGGHLVSLLERIEQGIKRQPQRIALSATVANIEDFILWLAGNSRSRGRIIDVPTTEKAKDFEVALFARDDDNATSPAADTPTFRRFVRVYEILHGKRSIVFVRSRRVAEAMAQALGDTKKIGLSPNLKIRTHHSAISKFFREEAERLIQVASEQGINGIISTSTLELGIDIGEIDRIVQLDALTSPSTFLQRVGRTGRRAGRPQCFRGLCVDLKDLVLLTAVVNLGLRGVSETLPLHRRCFHLLAHQLICLALQHNGVEPDCAWSILSHAHSFADIARIEFDRLVAHMIETSYLRDVDGLLVVADNTEKHFLGAGWRRLFAVFDSAPLYEVYEKKNQVGTLDACFVESLTPPFLFMLAARPWKALAVDYKRRIVRAKRSTNANAPRWFSFGGPDVPFETAREVGLLTHSNAKPSFLDPDAAAGLLHVQHQNAGIPWHEGEVVVIVSPKHEVRVVTYAGDRINRTLALSLAATRLGRAVADYRGAKVVIPLTDHDDPGETIVNVLEQLAAGNQDHQRRLGRRLSNHIKAVPFSPFARCLPEALAKEVLLERDYDCAGLGRLLSSSKVTVVRDE
jgi:ATP-dependent Lhr-like helicase